MHISERLRMQVAGLDMEHRYRPDGLRHHTISLGAALSCDAGLQQAQDLLARCDQLLYRAKQEGRNRACLA